MTRDEQAWLLDRTAHREPIDAYFYEAISAIQAPAVVLELGHGHLTDIRDRVIASGGDWYGVEPRRPDGSESPWGQHWRMTRTFAGEGNDEYDAVLAREVFEHVWHLREMLDEIHRVLKPGGVLIFSTPFIFPYHDIEPELGGDWWRLTAPAWRRLLAERGFVDIEVTEGRHLFDSWQMPISILGKAVKP